jgi:hypothetical protein
MLYGSSLGALRELVAIAGIYGGDLSKSLVSLWEEYHCICREACDTEMGKSTSHSTPGSSAWAMGVQQHSGVRQDKGHTMHRGEGALIMED